MCNSIRSPKFWNHISVFAHLSCWKEGLCHSVSLTARFSIYFSSQKPQKSYRIYRGTPQPVYSESNIILNTSICLSSMYITCKTNRRLTSDRSISWSFRLTHRPSLASCADWTGVQNKEAYGLKERWTVCVLSVTEWLASNVAKRIVVRTYKFRGTNKTCQPVCIFVSRNPWQNFTDPSLRNISLIDRLTIDSQ